MICIKCAHKYHTGCRGGTWCDCQHQGPEDKNEYIRHMIRSRPKLTFSVPVEVLITACVAETNLRMQMSTIMVTKS